MNEFNNIITKINEIEEELTILRDSNKYNEVLNFILDLMSNSKLLIQSVNTTNKERIEEYIRNTVDSLIMNYEID